MGRRPLPLSYGDLDAQQGAVRDDPPQRQITRRPNSLFDYLSDPDAYPAVAMTASRVPRQLPQRTFRSTGQRITPTPMPAMAVPEPITRPAALRREPGHVSLSGAMGLTPDADLLNFLDPANATQDLPPPQLGGPQSPASFAPPDAEGSFQNPPPPWLTPGKGPPLTWTDAVALAKQQKPAEPPPADMNLIMRALLEANNSSPMDPFSAYGAKRQLFGRRR